MKKPVTQTHLLAYPALLIDIATLVNEFRNAVVRAANCFMTAISQKRLEREGKRTRPNK